MDNLQNAGVSCRGEQDTQESGVSESFAVNGTTRINFVLEYDTNMRLSSIKYSEFGGQDSEWNLETVTLGPVNLLVGRNATGKTRFINVIAALSKLLADKLKRPLDKCAFDAKFSDQNQSYHYALEFDNFIVNVEELIRDGENVLHRGLGGTGRILAEDEGKRIRFQISGDTLAAVAKRDSLQHPFLNPLNTWGNCLRFFEFGKGLGHQNLAVAIKSDVAPTDESDTTQIVRVFHKGKDEFGNAFGEAIKSDLNAVGYDIEEIDIRKHAHLLFVNLPAQLGDVFGISVKERDLRTWTHQLFISQGMFRALSVIIQFNYSVHAQSGATILIDDIGEGLDYERSCALVKLLREKVLASNIQLIMSTNDRFIMNAVPLEEWCVLQRAGHNVKAFNYANAAAAFERFKKTGLSNFDLLTSNYVQEYVQRASQDGENGDLRRGSDGENLYRESNSGDGGDTPIPH